MVRFSLAFRSPSFLLATRLSPTQLHTLSLHDALPIFLSYGCEVDEFQHIMYQHPNLTADQRNDVWLRLEQKYRPWIDFDGLPFRSEEHTSELQSRFDLVCRLLLEKKNDANIKVHCGGV